MDSLILDTVIGLVFVFAVVSVATSLLTESASRLIGLRGEYLLRGIRTLVDGRSSFSLGWSDMWRKHTADPDPSGAESERPVVSRILNQPIIARTAAGSRVPVDAGNTKLSRQGRRALPAYVSGRSFARALIDVVVPDATGAGALGRIQNGLATDAASPAPRLNPELREQLSRFLAEADGDITRFRTSLEQWYDDHMARVSGWYKRQVRWISLGFAAVLVLAFNLNAVQISRSLYSDEALRGAVVSQAAQASSCGDRTPAACLRELRTQVDAINGSGLPIGWGTVVRCVDDPACSALDRIGLSSPGPGFWHDLGTWLLVLLGWAVMVGATVPGARFWFDALSRLGSLRSTGPKPPTA